MSAFLEFLIVTHLCGVFPKTVVGSNHVVVAGEVRPWFVHQGDQAGDEVQGFEDDVSGAAPVRCLEMEWSASLS